MRKCALGIVGLLIWLSFSILASAQDSKLTADELVARHLQSIGTREARTEVMSRVAEGKVTLRDRLARTSQMAGSAQFISQGQKFKCAFSFGAPNYPGEQFVFDGRDYQVAYVTPGARSGLGGFLYGQLQWYG